MTQEEIQIKNSEAIRPGANYFVTMTDKCMSGWGKAEGRINKYVIGCITLQDAELIERNAKRRDEMKYINIRTEKPYYNDRFYLVSYRTFDELGAIWKE
jgi:hypothetical protein